jgi:hypothetical protein
LPEEIVMPQPDRDSAVYQQAVAAFHRAWDTTVEVMRLQKAGLAPVESLMTTMALPWPLPEFGTEPYTVAVTIFVGPSKELEEMQDAKTS